MAAARDAFTAEGPDVSLDEIARRAGVGAGTVHRHFATKADLVETVLAAAVEDLVTTATLYADSDDPSAALRAFLMHLVTEGAAAHELAARLRVSADDVAATVSGPVADLDRAMAILLSRARDAGGVRDDVDERDLGTIVAAAHAARTSIRLAANARSDWCCERSTNGADGVCRRWRRAQVAE